MTPISTSSRSRPKRRVQVHVEVVPGVGDTIGGSVHGDHARGAFARLLVEWKLAQLAAGENARSAWSA
jgi:hypothetical protein